MDEPARTLFSLWAQVGSKYGVPGGNVSVDTRHKILVCLDTEGPAAERAGVIDSFHREVREVMTGALQRSLKVPFHEEPSVALDLWLMAEEGTGCEVARLALRIERLQTDPESWRLTLHQGGQMRTFCHDDASSALGHCLRAVEDMTRKWMSMIAAAVR